MKQKIDIRVFKNAKGDTLPGPFFIKVLNFDEVTDYFNKIAPAPGKSQDEKLNQLRLVQMCMVNSKDEYIFKPQQVNVIKNRVPGMDLLKAILLATKVNDLASLESFMEEYEKNSESDQDTD